MGKEGYITDYISGKEVRATPEEVEAVQVFAKSLVEDYNYPKTHIQTRPQHRVKIRPSDVKKEYPVDIAVFKSEDKQGDNAHIIVECKKRNSHDGKTQLQDYLRFSKANIGVWFNGKERIFLRKIEKDGQIIFDNLPNIPKYGQRVEDIGKFKRKDLTIPHSLKVIFRAIRNHLAGNYTGATRDEELAKELINLIFCKIYDEKFTKHDDMVNFRVGIDEDLDDVRNRILKIFEKVKTEYSAVIDVNDKINLDKNAISYVVGEMQPYCIMLSERDAVADAFETFIGYALKGSQGQFFTPRNIVKLMVEIIQPDPKERIIDPACGSGGFLVESLKYMWDQLEKQAKEYGWNDAALSSAKHETAIDYIRGIEKDKFLSKVTKAYMAIIGDGKGGIFCADSLERINEWQDNKAKQDIQLGNFDVLLTNPPFGKDIEIVGEQKLKQYDLAHKWKKVGDEYVKDKLLAKTNPQIIFIERSLQLLKNGGRMGIVLPETYFHGPSLKYVIKHLEKNNNIFAIIDLPHNTFRPNCNAKTVILFLQKNTQQQKEIFFGIVKEMGHNHLGKPIYRFDEKNKTITNEIWDDIPIVLENYKKDIQDKYTLKINSKDIKNSVYVPRYYEDIDKEYLNCEKDKFNFITMKDLIDKNIIIKYKGHGAPPNQYKGRGEIFYVRAGDILDWDIYKNPFSAIPYHIYKQSKGNGVDLKELDIVFVKEGSYRIGDVALLSKFDIDILLNHHSLIFRVNDENNEYGIDAFYLLYLLSHRLVKKQLPSKILIDTTLPNIGNRWEELKLPILIDTEKREEIKSSIKTAFSQKWENQELFYHLKNNLVNDEY